VALAHIYERLLSLPLFQGMSSSDLEQVIARTKFGFIKPARGKPVAEDGSPCRHLYILTEGTLKVECRADNGSYTLIEQMSAPDVIQPESLFGFTPRFTRTFSAEASCRLMSIDKQEMLKLMATQEIFRINLLNLICTRTQRLAHQPFRQPPQDIRQKIIRFVAERSLRPAGKKTLYIKMDVLGRLLGESRINISRTLHAMKDDGLVDMGRNRIVVSALEKLI